MEAVVGYLSELRGRLLRYLIVFGISLGLSLYFARDLYHWLALPILQHLAEGATLIATSVPAPFLIPFKTALLFSVLITVPYFLYQVWMFIMPALYRHERKFVWLLMVSSTLLFYLGLVFAYFVVLPIVFKFFIYIAPQGVEVRPDISQYLDFTVRMFLAFGFSFELPVAIMLLVWTGISTTESLAAKRPYVILGIFIAAMLLTPPDVISQLLLALPLWLLFELGLWLSRWLSRWNQ